MQEFIEYRVRPVARFIVTRCTWEANGEYESSGSVGQIGPEYASEDVAFEVAYALCSQEHNRLGYDLDDDRLIYPKRPSDADSVESQLSPSR